MRRDGHPDPTAAGRTFALLTERSIPDPIRALLARGAQPRGTGARSSDAFAPRGAGLSFTANA